jgi:hypothetical protein
VRPILAYAGERCASVRVFALRSQRSTMPAPGSLTARSADTPDSREVSTTRTVLAVAPVVKALTVVQQREQLDDIEPCSIRARHHQTIQPHPRPVRHTVNAPPLEPELLLHRPQD